MNVMAAVPQAVVLQMAAVPQAVLVRVSVLCPGVLRPATKVIMPAGL